MQTKTKFSYQLQGNHASLLRQLYIPHTCVDLTQPPESTYHQSRMSKLAAAHELLVQHQRNHQDVKLSAAHLETQHVRFHSSREPPISQNTQQPSAFVHTATRYGNNNNKVR